jgi:predicted Zn-dependent protease
MRSLPLLIGLAIAAPAPADMFKPSVSDQLKLGERAAKDIRKKEKVLGDSDWRTQLIRRIGSELVKAINDPKEPWRYTFDVIQSKELNAFALPGGPTFFYTGLIDKMKTEDEVAGVMAHELTHVRKEHWAKAYADSQKRNLGLLVLLSLARAGNTAFDIASVGNELLFSLPFSRKNETDADNGAIDLVVKAGYNPIGLADTFRMFDQEKKGGKPPEILATHPPDPKRIKNIEDKVAKLNRTFPAQRPLKATS